MAEMLYINGVTRPETAKEEAERLASVASALPAPLQPIMKYIFWKAVHDAFGLTKDEVIASIDASSMTADEKYLAKLGIETAVAYQRDDPNVVSLLNLMGYSEQEADDFWRWASPTF
ncbi:hypothetical protein [Rhizobium leguminosarum]|uniref:hypothetical protein n=1 Tax=Rhizobium leguminosarum TaxID=384 RepID=UPI0004895120|nr:hypothetical protein [Rhizobium leguminosarum]